MYCETGNKQTTGQLQNRAILTSRLTGLRDIVDEFDVFLLDLWGTLHNGKRVFSGVVECLQNLRSRGKSVFLLSNAPRRCDAVRLQLEFLGLQEDMYDDLMTSGELTHRFLQEHLRIETFYFLGPERDTNIFMGLERLKRVHEIMDANFILNTGTESYEDTVADYEPLLWTGLEYGLPMLCANPDQVVVIEDKCVICAGMLAQRYIDMNGTVYFWGKPYREIYEWSLSQTKGVTPDRVIAIGDNLRTDIQGAVMMGFSSILLPSGIHSEELEKGDDKSLLSLCERLGTHPCYVMETLTW